MCSTLLNAYMLTKLTLRYLLSTAMAYYDFLRALPGEISSYIWSRNKVIIYQSLKAKIQAFFFFLSKGKRKGKVVRLGKARRSRFRY